MRKFLALAAMAAALDASSHEMRREQIEVEGHYDNGVGTSDAASQGSVTARLIENRPVLRPAEILEFVPGVVITQHSGDGKANQYFLRGFNLDHGSDFATWVGGMPINMPTHAHGQGYTDLNFLIPELVRRIDYFKGPYFAREGDFSSAGAARIELVDHLNRNIADLTAGSFGYRRGVLAASPEIGSGTLLAALDLGRNDGPWKTPEDFRKWSGLLRYSQQGDDARWSVTAMGYEAKWNATDQVPLRAVNAGTLDRFGAVDPTDGGETARYSLSLEVKGGTDATPFTVSAYAIRSRLDLFSNFTYFLDDPVNGDQFQQSERRTVVGGEMSRSWARRVGSLEVTDTLGLQVRHDDIDPVGLYPTVARDRIGTTREDRVKESSAGLYYGNATRWTPWLRTLAGLRYDRYRFRVASNVPENSGNVSSGVTSPKLSAIFGPWANVELFANWGRGFHSNDARGTTIRVDPKTGEPVDRVTPLARTNGAEIGLRTELLPGWQSSIALWQLRLDSELIFVGDAGTTEASRPSKRHGVEWNNHYVVNPNLLLDLDIAASHARFTDSDPAGDHIPGALDRVVSFGASLTDLGPWSAGFHLRYFGPRPLIEDNSVRSKATTLASARLAYRINKEWKVSLDVFNLFDRKASDIDYFYASRLPGEPAGGVDDIHFHPVEPRSYRVTFSYRF
jgi:outer membrane receptor protein involved in Fe transport